MDASSALLLVEFQREWLDADSGKLNALMKDRGQFTASVEGARRALRAARASEMHVVHVPCVFQPDYPEIGGRGAGGLFAAIPEAGTWTGAGRVFADDFQPLGGEFVVEGRVGASAFAHSNLDAYLRHNDVTDLYLAGYALHVCVESTLRDGHDLGYAMYVVEDATSAFTADQRRHVLDHVVHHFGRRIRSERLPSGQPAAHVA